MLTEGATTDGATAIEDAKQALQDGLDDGVRKPTEPEADTAPAAQSHVAPRATQPSSPGLLFTNDEVLTLNLAERLISSIEKVVDARLSASRPSTAVSSAPLVSSVSLLPDREDAPAEAKQRKPKRERGSKLAYKRVDEIWDEKVSRYYIAEQVNSGISDLDLYSFLVRDRINRKTHEIDSYVDLKSPVLRDIMREVCRDIRNVSLAENAPSIEQRILFHVRGELKARHAASADGSPEQQHLGLFVEYVEKTFRETEDHLAELLGKKEITYDLLWALFEPNTEVYTTCRGTGAPRCVLCNFGEERHEGRDGPRAFHLETRCLNTDGRVLGEAVTTIKIDKFLGAKRLEHLPAYPLRFHPQHETVRVQLVECGRRFVSLMGIHHRQYDGKAFLLNDDGEVVVRHVRSRIMVDAVCFQERNPNYPCPRVHKVKPRFLFWSRSLRDANVDLTEVDPARLEEADFLICSPTVLGFSLDSKTFLEFAVINIREVEWSPCSFDDVRIPEKQKAPIMALTRDYLNREAGDGFQDMVQGKGKGVNFLLYGPPGVGKTLTAEMMAETLRMPLYAVPAGQIGVDPVKVESILATIFKVVSRWKAILLLDEADVFMAQRSNDHLQLNALVSVFLRELEQYDGILFLTTNRVQSFDDAMVSRIHLALKYGRLGPDARRSIWRFFLSQARTRAGEPSCGKSVINTLAKKQLNGREIRNAVFVARSMAEHAGTVVSQTLLEEAIAAKEQFHYDVAGVGAIENLQSYT